VTELHAFFFVEALARKYVDIGVIVILREVRRYTRRFNELDERIALLPVVAEPHDLRSAIGLHVDLIA
jgi:hypothetical protein